jgi:hydroxymethylpyrimidine pyrophosphatase-like HAD family hydrolase
MHYLALATDYDGTLAHHDRVEPSTLEALVRLRASGRTLILVTGRELEDLMRIFPRLDLFDRVVTENGALLYRPADRSEAVFGQRPPESFLEALRARRVSPLSVGRVIVATWQPHGAAVVDTIRRSKLDRQAIFNKRAVMILPSGVNKASGLAAALEELKLAPANVVAVGDAENDHDFLSLCGLGVAVSNAIESLKERADLVTRRDQGAGVVEVIDRLIADDLAGLNHRERD